MVDILVFEQVQVILFSKNLIKEEDMEESEFHVWACEIADKKDFVIGETLQREFYYGKRNMVSIMFDVKMKVAQNASVDAVLKIYNDPRIRFEYHATTHYAEFNKSQLLVSPKVYDGEAISAHKGWLLMEKLPAEVMKFSTPIPASERESLLRLFLEYRRNAPKEPNRDLAPIETLSSDVFHVCRISRWLEMASRSEAACIISGDKPLLKDLNFMPLYEKALYRISDVYSHSKQMVWSAHGLFRPEDIYRVAEEDQYYLTDFCRAKMYPPGYELATIVWADWFNSANWQLEPAVWTMGLEEWLAEIEKLHDDNKTDFAEMGLYSQGVDFVQILGASLIERIVGTILADICASDKDKKEKEKRLELLGGLLKKMLTS